MLARKYVMKPYSRKFVLGLLNAMIMLVLFQRSSAAMSGNMAFTGNISRSTCLIDVNGSGQKNGTISIPNVPMLRLKEVMDYIEVSGFYIRISECDLADPPAPEPPPTIGPNGMPATIWPGSQRYQHFTTVRSIVAQFDNDELGVKNRGTAENLYLQFHANPAQSSIYYQKGFAMFPFRLIYWTLSGNVSTGTVYANVEYTIHYR